MNPDGVTIVLDARGVDLVGSTPFHKFCQMMRRQKKALHWRFQHVEFMGMEDGNENHLLHAPYDVKISHQFQLVIVADHNSSRVKFFDLKTKEFLTSWVFTYPNALVVENGTEEHLVVGGDTVQKFALRAVRENSQEQPMWNYAKSSINGLCVKVVKGGNNLIYVCSGDLWSQFEITVLNSRTGLVVQQFGSHHHNIYSPRGRKIVLGSVSRIGFLRNGTMVISSGEGHCIKMFKEHDNALHRIRSFGQYGKKKTSFHYPRGVVIDECSQNILICDSWNDRLQLFDQELNLLYSFTKGPKQKTFRTPLSACIDHSTGKLYVAYSGDKYLSILE